jgi:hypothetical protein
MGNSEHFDEFPFDVDATSAGSSGEAYSARPVGAGLRVPNEIYGENEEASPILSLLSRPVLPDLDDETRARLMMQSPTRLYFYWSVGRRSFQALSKTVGDAAADYRLVLRLLDLTHDVEELHAVDADGSWWFAVTPDTEYRAEVGFYSASRPFVRILFSNTITTPRKAPSPNSAAEARWAVTTHDFAQVLDVSGFSEDALDVVQSSRDETFASRFAHHVGIAESAMADLDITELRRALMSLADGTPIADLRYKIAARTFAVLQEHLSKLSRVSIRKRIGTFDDVESESFTAVGGSLVSIPKRRYRPVSSMNVR